MLNILYAIGQYLYYIGQPCRLTSNVWAGYSIATLSTRPLRARYSPATRSLLAVDLHVWFFQDEEVFTQQVQ